MKKYQKLHDGIYMGGADDVEDMVKNEKCDVIIDLRDEVSAPSTENPNLEYIHIPLIDGEQTEDQDQSLKNAINTVIQASKEGKTVAFHCAAGRNRTGSVAIGTLISLGLFDTYEDAEKEAQRLRPEIIIKKPLKESLNRMFPKE
ncbi:thioredoxin reductase (NADPH) [Paenibacillus endophyticus]|uniref:Thioredoxin reductase (NADPH) n=1 Tax=Paenibacillus endophyticus TaxID=1294268 RepID=A0A7W5GBM7_9BACL|nr:dual specificity protein phosphatase [Paenibacillus endophyticus]MBB3153563.1 thioredoxin reductase (NADPH) [Paenibacillus endophyticus]